MRSSGRSPILDLTIPSPNEPTFALRQGATRTVTPHVLYFVFLGLAVGAMGFLTMMLVHPERSHGPTPSRAFELPPPAVSQALTAPPVLAPPPPVVASAEPKIAALAPVSSERGTAPTAKTTKAKTSRSKNVAPVRR